MTSQGSRPETIPKKRHRVPGDTNIKGKGFDLHPQVAIISVALIVLFVALTLIFREQADQIFKGIQNTVSNILGWFLILAANIYLGVVVILSFSKYGKIRLGGPDAKPEFSTFGWFAMLLSAGMGIGLMFWSVAEPVYHFGDPAPFFGNVADGSTAAAQAAMGITFYHWGLHAWGIYALVGLATSLGFGAEQVSAGLNFLFDSPDTVWVQVVLIAIITSFATASVVAGLDSGVRFLSEINIYVAAAFMAFLLLAGPTLFLLSSLVQNFGYYASIFLGLSFWTETFDGGKWQQSWTIFY